MSMQQKALFDFSQFGRFASVGAINSLIGYAIILAALFLGAGDFIANALGYAVGLTIGYVLNKNWAFSKNRGYRQLSWVSYAIIFCIAYGANLFVVTTALNLGFVESPLTHLAAMATYTAIFYIGLVAVTAERDGLQRPIALLKKTWPETLVALGILISFFLLINIPLSHDVVWQMWIARQLLGGAELYRDILEINPPLWFWMAVPAELLAQSTGLSSKHAIIAAVFTYAGLAMGTFATLIHHINPLRRLAILAMAATAMILVTLPDFGQREQLALIGAIPYAALIARRIEGRATHYLIALLVAAIAAPAFALKHYFVLVPVFLEAWLLFSQRRKYCPFRPETLILGVCALGYALAIYLFAPGFFQNIVPMVQLAYHGYEIPLWMLFIRPQVLLWGGGVLVFFILPGRHRPLAIACTLIAIAFMLAYFLQQKGWRYHSLAATGALLLGLLTALDPPHDTLKDKLKFATTTLLVFFGLQITLFAGPYTNTKREAVTALLENTPIGSTVMMISASPSTIWPMVDDMNHVWPSRHFAYWMLTTIARDIEANGALTPDMQRLADNIRTHAAQDLSCHPPDIILVDDHKSTLALGLDAVAFFSESDRFAELFSHYSYVGKQSRYTSYVRQEEWQPKKPENCREIF